MVYKVLIVIAFSMLFLFFFVAGVLWKGRSIGTAPRFKVKVPLEIQVSSSNLGIIPNGTVLYKYKTLPEITTYYMFINLKERDVLEACDESNKLFFINPITAYPKDLTVGNEIDEETDEKRGYQK